MRAVLIVTVKGVAVVVVTAGVGAAVVIGVGIVTAAVGVGVGASAVRAISPAIAGIGVAVHIVCFLLVHLCIDADWFEGGQVQFFRPLLLFTFLFFRLYH